jgi:chromate transporter
MSDPARSKVNPRLSLLRLFLTFLRLGATAFGGISMVAYLRRSIVEQRGWMSNELFNQGLVLCQMIPGATTLLLATYIGLKLRGRMGAVLSLIGFSLPAFLMMLVLAAFFTHNQEHPFLAAVMGGLQAIIVAIIANATFCFGKDIYRDWKALSIAALAAVLYAARVNPMLVILVAALAGLFFYRFQTTVQQPTPALSTPGQSGRFMLVSLSLAALGLGLLYTFERSLFELAFAMLKISLFSFGGGFAAVPLMMHEVVEVQGWMDTPTFLNGIILGQVTPGPVIITATYIGYYVAGLIGAAIATASIFLPSLLILVAIVPYFDRLRASPLFTGIIKGILCSFVGLLLTLTIRFALDVQWNPVYILMAVAAFTALFRKVDPLWVILAGTALSSLVYFL